MVKKLEELQVNGKKVLVRCDFNVPLKNSVIQDDTRIREALPTIKSLLNKNAAVILMSHLGRPNGTVVPELSLKPVAVRLSELLDTDVKFCPETIGSQARQMADNLKPGELMLLENLRFNSGEKENDEEFAEAIASLGDAFVQDAFGTVHRKHASICGVPGILPSAAGKLLQKEIDYLSKGLNPEHPMAVCLGGAKLETKIPVIKNMIDRADAILVGGGMAYTLLKAAGRKIGNSLLDEENLKTAEDILSQAQEKKVDLEIPEDHIITDSIEQPKKIEKTDGADIPEGMIGVDIGEKTLNKYKEKILSARTIVLNGPMGVFEEDKFAAGTRGVLEAIVEATEKGASSIAGGGDTVSAIKNLGFSIESFTHVSTGGGASLKFLEGAKLPGIEVLK